jgi:hypothetical protein
MEKPIMITLVNGEIKSAKISRDEPVWSVNFKKALALQFQTKMDVSSGNWRQQQQQQQQQQQPQNNHHNQQQNVVRSN